MTDEHADFCCQHMHNPYSDPTLTCCTCRTARAYPEPEVGTILLATTDARVWVRGPHSWASTWAWFGFSWEDMLRRYSPDELMTCSVGPTLAEASEQRA